GPGRQLMANSPVHRLLSEVMAEITPLGLTDPASPFFTPGNCRTLHDVTRFCHEKAVQEMFGFGGRLGFPERLARQMVGEMPSQWWAIDLADGFRPGIDAKSRYIAVTDIVSRPMLALWAGITAVPWDGPPPVSLRGLGSIFFQSTMNPSLDPAVRSSMAAKSYFLVSKDFCNLSVRLGYHFSMVEAYVSDMLTESYVSFQFKGGAADAGRKATRVALIAEILTRYGFRVEPKADSLTARLEKRPTDVLETRLRVLGYLLIHTRQIDMVMADPGMVAHYRTKILADLEALAPGAAEQ
ncbi:MAG: pyruvate, water dikinase, partial [Thermodesulfobacteriota bacterium]